MALAFPTGGVEPFVGITFTLITAATLILVLVLPRAESRLRLAAVLYIVMCLVLFMIDTPIGGNATRLGALMAALLLALGAWGRRPAWLVSLAILPLIYAGSRRSATLRTRLASRRSRRPTMTRSSTSSSGVRRSSPSAFRCRRLAIAGRPTTSARASLRGWLRQAESDDFDLFQDGNLTADSYRAWLDERGVAFVALSLGAEPDGLSEDEIELVQSGLPYLDEVWSNDDWELYDVSEPAPLAAVPMRLDEAGFELDAAAPGETRLKVRFSPYYRVTEGDACASARRVDRGRGPCGRDDPGRSAAERGRHRGRAHRLGRRLLGLAASTQGRRRAASSSAIVAAESRCRIPAMPIASAPATFSRRSSTNTASSGSTPRRSDASR